MKTRILMTIAAAAVALTSCNNDEKEPTGNTPPHDKYPVSFAIAVNGLTATRATVDNSWAGTEEVATQIGGEVKKYKAATDGKLTPADVANTFYWQKSDETKNVSAWYCGTGYSHTQPTTWAVQTDQSGTDGSDNYQKSDFLYAPAMDIAFPDRETALLNFYHQTARVVVNIVNAEAATSAAAIRSVSVIGTATQADYTAPTGGSTAGTWSNPHTIASIALKETGITGSTYLKSYTALVIPQQMQGKKFIAVTLSDDSIYYYTPEADNDANLTSGKQHTYDITVKNDGDLEVKVSTTNGEWGGGTTENVTGGSLIYSANDLKPGDYYYSDGTWSDGGLRKVLSDGKVEKEDVQPKSGGSTCIGLVFWAGDATAQDKTLKADHPDCTRGLVVALKKVSGSPAIWQNPYISVQDWLDSEKKGEFLSVQSSTTVGVHAPLNNIQGYNNTKAIESFNAANSDSVVQAVQAVVGYRSAVSAPAGSSDWYFPSAKELTLLFGKEADNIWTNGGVGIENRRYLDAQLSNLQKLGNEVHAFSQEYWSSTELYDRSGVNDRAFYLSSVHGVQYRAKDQKAFVRCVLAF